MDNNHLSEEDRQLLKQANSLLQLADHSGWKEYLLPFLLNLAQSNYPQPKDFKTKEELILRYTEKVGETNAIKTIIDFVSSQESVIKSIAQKQENKDAYAI